MAPDVAGRQPSTIRWSREAEHAAACSSTKTKSSTSSLWPRSTRTGRPFSRSQMQVV